MGADLKKRMLQLVRRVELTRGQHYKFVAPNGRCCFGPGTPSEYRGLRNVVRKLRQLGLNLC